VTCFSQAHRDVARALHEAPLVLFLIEIFFQYQSIQSPPYAIELPLASASNRTIHAWEKDSCVRVTVQVAYYETA